MRQATTAKVRLDAGKAARFSASAQSTDWFDSCCARRARFAVAPRRAKVRSLAPQPRRIRGMSVYGARAPHRAWRARIDRPSPGRLGRHRQCGGRCDGQIAGEARHPRHRPERVAALGDDLHPPQSRRAAARPGPAMELSLPNLTVEEECWVGIVEAMLNFELDRALIEAASSGPIHHEETLRSPPKWWVAAVKSAARAAEARRR